MLQNPIQLPADTQTFLDQIRRKFDYWLHRLPHLFPSVSDIKRHVHSAFDALTEHSNDDIVEQLLAANGNDETHIQNCILDINEQAAAERDAETALPQTSQANSNEAQIKSIKKVLDTLFQDYAGTVELHVPDIVKQARKRIDDAKLPWINIEIYASLTYLFVRKQISGHALNLLLSSLHKLASNPDCCAILDSGPQNITDLLVYILQSTQETKYYKSTVPAGEYDSIQPTRKASKSVSKLGAQEHEVIFADPLGPWKTKLQSLRHQQYIQLLKQQRFERDKFFGEIFPKLQTSDFTKQVCSQIPFCRSSGLLCREYNKQNPSFPLYIIPGCIVKCTPDDKPKVINANNQDDEDDVNIITAEKKIDDNAANDEDDVSSQDQDTTDSDIDYDITQEYSHLHTKVDQTSKYLFVTNIRHHYMNIAHKEEQIDHVINLNAKSLTDEEWELLDSNPATTWPNPKLEGIRLETDPKYDNDSYLIHRLNRNNNAKMNTLWDVAQLSKDHTIEVFNAKIGHHFTNYAIIAPGYESLIHNVTWTCCINNDNQRFDVLQIIPHISNIGEIFPWVSKPEIYQVPNNIHHYFVSPFVDALQVRHASAHTPSLNLIQTRDLNEDPSSIHTAAITWHYRGLNRVLRPITRMLLHNQIYGCVTRKMNIQTKKLEPAVIFTSLGSIVTDRVGLSEVTMVAHPQGINNIPKILGDHKDNYPFNNWRNPNCVLKADCYKNQLFINALINFINRFTTPKKHKKFKLRWKAELCRAAGITEESLLQQSRMPGIAVIDSTISEFSHCLLGGVVPDVSRFMTDVIIDDDPDDVRHDIISIMWDHMQNFCKNSYEDSVTFDSIRTSKVGWKFIYNYIGALRLLACLPCFSFRQDREMQNLIVGLEKLLTAISRPFGPFWNNEERVQCATLYEEFLRTFYESQIRKPVRNWSKSYKKITKKKADDDIKLPVDYQGFERFKIDNVKTWPNALPYDINNEKSVVFWSNKWREQQLKDLQAQRQRKHFEFEKTRHREKSDTKAELPHARSAISAPNCAYGMQFYHIDLYEMGGGHLLNSMIMESSLSDPKLHAQKSSTKKLSTVLTKIADSLYFKQQFDNLLLESVDPTQQPNLFKMMSVPLRRNLLASLSSNAQSLVVHFNANVKWIESTTWANYLQEYDARTVEFGNQENIRRANCNPPLDRLNALTHYLSPDQVSLSDKSWANNSIRDVHQGLVNIIGEFLYCTDLNDKENTICDDEYRFKWYELLISAVSDDYKKTLNIQQQNEAKARFHQRAPQPQDDQFVNDKYQKQESLLYDARNKLSHGIIKIRTRVLGTINITRNSSVDCSLRPRDFIWSWRRLGMDLLTKYHVAARIVRIFQIENFCKLMSFLPKEMIPYEIFMLCELWKPCKETDWKANIPDMEYGNFVWVKLGKKAQYRLVMETPYLKKYIILFANDTIMKLTPWPMCNNLTEAQYKNWSKKYKKNAGKQIWNYAFDGAVNADWRETGGCVVVPQCSQCDTFGCKRHMKENVKQEDWPQNVRIHHTCQSNKDEYCSLLSSQQMIIHQFLKTQSMQHTRLQSNDEQLVSDVMNKINVELVDES